MKKGIWVVIGAFVLGGILGAMLGLQISNFGARIEKLETASTSLEAKVGDLESQTQRLGDLEGRLVKLENALEELNVTTCAGLDELRADVEDLKTTVADLKDSLGAVSARQGEADSKIQKLSADIEALKADIDNKIADLRSEFDGKLSGLAGELSSVKGEVSRLSAALLKVGYIKTDAIIPYILSAQPEWKAVEEKLKAIEELEAKNKRGEITAEEYEAKLNVLNVEALIAHHGVLVGLLERMIASPAFGEEKAHLEAIKESMDILAADLKALLEDVKAGALDKETFNSKFSSLSDQLARYQGTIEGILSKKVDQVAGEVAEDKGIGLVLRYDADLILYNAALVEDLTAEVEERIMGILGG